MSFVLTCKNTVFDKSHEIAINTINFRRIVIKFLYAIMNQRIIDFIYTSFFAMYWWVLLGCDQSRSDWKFWIGSAKYVVSYSEKVKSLPAQRFATLFGCFVEIRDLKTSMLVGRSFFYRSKRIDKRYRSKNYKSKNIVANVVQMYMLLIRSIIIIYYWHFWRLISIYTTVLVINTTK